MRRGRDGRSAGFPCNLLRYAGGRFSTGSFVSLRLYQQRLFVFFRHVVRKIVAAAPTCGRAIAASDTNATTTRRELPFLTVISATMSGQNIRRSLSNGRISQRRQDAVFFSTCVERGKIAVLYRIGTTETPALPGPALSTLFRRSCEILLNVE